MPSAAEGAPRWGLAAAKLGRLSEWALAKLEAAGVAICNPLRWAAAQPAWQLLWGWLAKPHSTPVAGSVAGAAAHSSKKVKVWNKAFTVASRITGQS